MDKIKYDEIGIGYNSTRQADPYLTNRLFDLLKPGNGKLYLDIGCGTGNYTIALADKGLSFTGVEPSEKMLREAKACNQKVSWLKGTAEQIPTADGMFDGVIATLTIHHWRDLKKAFVEISRVLSSKGRIILFTATPKQMKGYWLNHYFPEMLNDSIAQMPSLDDIEEAATYAGLTIINTEKYFIKDDLRDCFLYVGKKRPELYFNKKVRSGISSFSSLSNIEEVTQGLAKLKNDIENETFKIIAKQYKNKLGDYLFLTFKKRLY